MYSLTEFVAPKLHLISDLLINIWILIKCANKWLLVSRTSVKPANIRELIDFLSVKADNRSLHGLHRVVSYQLPAGQYSKLELIVL